MLPLFCRVHFHFCFHILPDLTKSAVVNFSMPNHYMSTLWYQFLEHTCGNSAIKENITRNVHLYVVVLWNLHTTTMQRFMWLRFSSILIIWWTDWWSRTEWTLHHIRAHREKSTFLIKQICSMHPYDPAYKKPILLVSIFILFDCSLVDMMISHAFKKRYRWRSYWNIAFYATYANGFINTFFVFEGEKER